MAVRTVFEHERYHNIGLSTDTKPPGQTPLSTFIEYDTGLEFITYDGYNWVGKESRVANVFKEVRTSVDIDCSDCTTILANDILGNDDCCTTTAVAWTFEDVVDAVGGYGEIVGATLVSETENQGVQYDLLLFNAAPTNTLLSCATNDNPQKEDISKYLGTIVFPISAARGADVATYSQASPTLTTTNLPMAFKCASTVADLYGVLVTRTAYTHTTGDAIEITLLVKQC